MEDIVRRMRANVSVEFLSQGEKQPVGPSRARLSVFGVVVGLALGVVIVGVSSRGRRT